MEDIQELFKDLIATFVNQTGLRFPGNIDLIVLHSFPVYTKFEILQNIHLTCPRKR